MLPNTPTTPNVPTFRSRNNNIIWIKEDNNSNKVPGSNHKLSAFVTSNYQWKAFRDLTQIGPPENQSINLSLIAQLPENRPFTPQESKILEELDPLIFDLIVIIE